MCNSVLIERIDHGIIVSKTNFSSEETEHRGNDGIETAFRLCSCLEDFFYRLDFFCFYYTNTFGMDIHTFNVFFDVKHLLLVFFILCKFSHHFDNTGFRDTTHHV